MKVYQYNEDEKVIINTYDNKNHKFWYLKKLELAPLRKNLRKHYLPLQKFRCCYCKMLKQESHGTVWDVEHIVPKALYPHFMFEQFNLCISCKECNGFKLETNVFKIRRSYKKYPLTSNSYKIIHPHLDNYSEHIDVKMYPNGHLAHFAKTEKGVETYICCNLIRFSMQANNYDIDSDLLLKFSNLIGDSSTLSADTAKAFFKASLPQSLPAEELNC